MYKIVETIHIAGTLNPQFIPDSSQKGAYEYLASNGLIRREGSAVSFFHQSFYEYTLARHYSETGSLFSSDLKKEIQGLEIRSRQSLISNEVMILPNSWMKPAVFLRIPIFVFT